MAKMSGSTKATIAVGLFCFGAWADSSGKFDVHFLVILIGLTKNLIQAHQMTVVCTANILIGATDLKRLKRKQEHQKLLSPLQSASPLLSLAVLNHISLR